MLTLKCPNCGADMRVEDTKQGYVVLCLARCL